MTLSYPPSAASRQRVLVFAWLSLCMVGSGARAQDAPVFTAPLVHPADVAEAPSSQAGDGARHPATRDATRAPVRVRPISRTGNGLAARGKPAGPRGHALEMVDVFQKACIDTRGDAVAAADWALHHGFVAAPAEDRSRASEAVSENGEVVNVFSREADRESVLLMSSDSPQKCAVMARRPVDGIALRASMQRMAAAWVGQREAPKPVVTMNLGGSDRASPDAGIMIGYRFTRGAETHTLLVVSPETAGAGVAFMTLMVADAPASR